MRRAVGLERHLSRVRNKNLKVILAHRQWACLHLERCSPASRGFIGLRTVRNTTRIKNWQRWTKVSLAVSAMALLASYKPLPSLVDQIKTLGELRVATRVGPLAFYRGPDDTPEGPEYELARRFADELGVKLKITPMRSYADIYTALTAGRAHLAAAGLKVPSEAVAGIEFGPPYQRVREHVI